MRWLFLALVVGGSLGAANLALSSPVDGSRSTHERVGEMSDRTLVERFRGGERACVIVRGDHKPVVNVEVHISDDKGRPITKDVGGGDLVAVTWYPPRDGNYTIRIVNHGKEYNECYVVLK